MSCQLPIRSRRVDKTLVAAEYIQRESVMLSRLANNSNSVRIAGSGG